VTAVRRAAAILLVGGRSTRMGRPKAELGWSGTSFTAHLVELLADAVDGPIVVVRAADQVLPALRTGVEVVEDARPGRGPLEGVAAGLRAVAGRAEAAFVSGVDVPLLQAAFVRCVLAALGPGFGAAVPRRGDQVYPLSAAYRVAMAVSAAEGLLARDERRARGLLDELHVRWLDEGDLLSDPELAAADPALFSLENVNTPEEYEAALRRLGG
jgi:molybdopterin-guanine dinucleotide biosynthesis protein A